MSYGSTSSGPQYGRIPVNGLHWYPWSRRRRRHIYRTVWTVTGASKYVSAAVTSTNRLTIRFVYWVRFNYYRYTQYWTIGSNYISFKPNSALCSLQKKKKKERNWWSLIVRPHLILNFRMYLQAENKIEWIVTKSKIIFLFVFFQTFKLIIRVSGGSWLFT